MAQPVVITPQTNSPQDIQETKPEIPEAPQKSGGSRLGRLKNWYGQHKKLSIPITILLVILLLLAVPWTRYKICGLFMKKNFTVQVLDSATSRPVSGAQVSASGKMAQTDNNGDAILDSVSVGDHQVVVTKKYYADSTSQGLVPLLKQKNPLGVKLIATGRQAKVIVTDLVSKKPLANAEIKAADTSAKTDKNGVALIVLPPDKSEQTATVTLNGYNKASPTIKVSDSSIVENQVPLTPAGTVYFLSKLSGKIDVVKTNLDGSGRQTVLAGTGNEDDQNTVLLASRDWKYLALLSRRAGSSATLYLIDTSDDSLSTIDEGNAIFGLDGWSGSNFVYTVTRNDTQLWQNGRQALKAFNAQAKKITVLDQTTGSGSSNYSYTGQLIGDVYVDTDSIYYIMNWTGGINSVADVSSKQATFNSVKPDGTSKKSIRSFGLVSGTQAIDVSLDSKAENPSAIDLKFSDGTKDNFYTYESGQVKDDPTMTDDTFYGTPYPTYLLSPSGNQTFWSEPRDGKNTLFIGDQNGSGGKQIATLSDYFTYGWYTDNYLLVSKNSSELYIVPVAGFKTDSGAVKISDYHKPVQSFSGYGGGYGGI